MAELHGNVVPISPEFMGRLLAVYEGGKAVPHGACRQGGWPVSDALACSSMHPAVRVSATPRFHCPGYADPVRFLARVTAKGADWIKLERPLPVRVGGCSSAPPAFAGAHMVALYGRIATRFLLSLLLAHAGRPGVEA